MYGRLAVEPEGSLVEPRLFLIIFQRGEAISKILLHHETSDSLLDVNPSPQKSVDIPRNRLDVFRVSLLINLHGQIHFDCPRLHE